MPVQSSSIEPKYSGAIIMIAPAETRLLFPVIIFTLLIAVAYLIFSN